MEKRNISQLFCGDTFEVLKTLPSESVNVVMTSPPYWQARDYKVAGQYGLESTIEEYLQKMWAVMDELWREVKVRKSKKSCIICKLSFENLKSKLAFRPLTNKGNRMDRICINCMESLIEQRRSTKANTCFGRYLV